MYEGIDSYNMGPLKSIFPGAEDNLIYAVYEQGVKDYLYKKINEIDKSVANDKQKLRVLEGVEYECKLLFGKKWDVIKNELDKKARLTYLKYRYLGPCYFNANVTEDEKIKIRNKGKIWV